MAKESSLLSFLAGAAVGAAVVLLADKKKVSALLGRLEKVVVGKNDSDNWDEETADEQPTEDDSQDKAE